MPSSISANTAARSLEYLTEAFDDTQKLYVEARALGSVPVVAARMAGAADPEAQAAQFEKDPAIRMATEAAIRSNAFDTQITRDDVLRAMKDAALMAESSTEYRQAWREIAQLMGMYEHTKKVEVTGSIEVIEKNFRKASDEDLARIAAQGPGATIEGEWQILDFEEEETGEVARLET